MAHILTLVTLHFSFATAWNYLELRAQLRWVTPNTSVVCVPSSARFLRSQRQSILLSIQGVLPLLSQSYPALPLA